MLAQYSRDNAGLLISYSREGGEKVSRPLTALFLGLVRSVLAVFDGVTHFGAIDALAILTQELLGSLAFGGCSGKKQRYDQHQHTELQEHQH